MLTRGYQSSMGHLQDASLADWDTHAKQSAATPTPSKRTTRSPGAYSDLLLLYGPGPGISQPTRIHIPQVATHKWGDPGTCPADSDDSQLENHCTINLFSVPYGAKYGCQPADSDSASLEHYRGITTR